MSRKSLKADELVERRFSVALHPSTHALLKREAAERGLKTQGRQGHCQLARMLIEQGLGVRQGDGYVS